MMRNKQKAMGKVLSVMITMLMVLTLLPTVAWAEEISSELPTLVTGGTPTIIGFGGHQWVVIGDETSVVATGNAKHLTLLLDGHLGTSPFNDTITDNSYSGSTLHAAMNTAAGNLSTKEQALIIPTDLDGSSSENAQDGMTGGNVDNALFWPLSVSEAYAVGAAGGLNLRIEETWWLRSPGDASMHAAMVFPALVAPPGYPVDFDFLVVRPAFKLDLSSVIFTSAASGTSGKSAATVGSALEAAQPPTGAVKLTVLDDINLSLTVPDTSAQTALPGDTLSIAYTGAQTGTGHSVSVLLCDTSGNPLYYGRPGDATSGTGNGTASFTVPAGLAAGSYTLKIFNEEVNGNNLTDFASTPVNIALTVLQLQTLTDPATGSTVTGSFTAGTMLTSDSILHLSGCSACDTIRSKQAAGEIVVMHNLILSAGTHGGGDVTVSIPMNPQLYEGQPATIYHCASGTLETVNTTVANGRAGGMFSSLSPFAVAATAKAVVSNGSTTSGNPKTADDTPLGLMITLIVVAGAGMTLGIRRRFVKS